MKEKKKKNLWINYLTRTYPLYLPLTLTYRDGQKLVKNILKNPHRFDLRNSEIHTEIHYEGSAAVTQPENQFKYKPAALHSFTSMCMWITF